MGITSSQVRQDFFTFGGFGLQGYGYDVELLCREIGNILGLGIMYQMVIIGAGNLGQALAKHTSFEKRGFRVIGIFDVSDRIIGEKISGVEIMHIDSLAEFTTQNHVDIAVVTVPYAYAREVVDKAVGLGIKGIWNFASAELKVPDDVVIENIHLSDSLIVLGYNLKKKGRETDPSAAKDK